MFAEGEGEGTGWIGSLWLIDAHSGIGSGKAVGSGCTAQGTVSSHLRQKDRGSCETQGYICACQGHLVVQ